MERDLTLIRELLLYVEATCEGGEIKRLDYEHFKSFDQKMVYGHERLLREKGLLRNGSQRIGMLISLYGLTWEGHDFLDSIRNPEVWRKTKEATNKVGGWTLEFVGEIAKGFFKTQIEKHTGVEL